jgi:serine/threonine protein kinase
MKRQRTLPVPNTVPSSGAPAPAESGPELVCTDATAAHDSDASGATQPASGSDCLTDDEVLAFLAGGMSRRMVEQIDAHIDTCSHCFDLVSAATPDGEIVAVQEGSQRFGGLALRVGSTVAGRYRVRRFVDRGGMGEVYEAIDLKLNERVALKTVLCSVGDSAHAVRKLFAEVQLARRIAHRHVCRIYELHEHAEPHTGAAPVHFLTMEFIEGEKLGKHLSQGPLPLAEAQAIARQLLLGLEAAHEAGVLHLDFKSDNVMLRSGSAMPDAIVMDFGLARALDTQSRLRASELGQIAGSVAYMAPEQVECQPVLGEAADIYAFGVVMFEMLTGQLPFDGQSPAVVMLKRLKCPPPVPSSLRGEIPRALDEFVLTCLNRDPRRRYANASQALAALERISLTPAPQRRPRKLVLGASLAGLVSFLGLALALLGALGTPLAEPSVARQPLEPSEGRAAPATPAGSRALDVKASQRAPVVTAVSPAVEPVGQAEIPQPAGVQATVVQPAVVQPSLMQPAVAQGAVAQAAIVQPEVRLSSGARAAGSERARTGEARKPSKRATAREAPDRARDAADSDDVAQADSTRVKPRDARDASGASPSSAAAAPPAGSDALPPNGAPSAFTDSSSSAARKPGLPGAPPRLR